MFASFCIRCLQIRPRLSRCYILVTNTLFAIFGAALIAFGVMGAQHRIESSILIPVNILKSM